MNLFEEYKDFYDKEIEFSDRLNQKISNTLTLLLILGSGEIIIFKDCIKHFNTVYYILCCISLLFFLLLIRRFYSAYSGYEYAYYPIAETKDVIEKTFQIVESKNLDKNIAEKHIEKISQENYIKAAIINREQNLLKSKNHMILTKWIIRTSIIEFIVFSFYIIVS